MDFKVGDFVTTNLDSPTFGKDCFFGVIVYIHSNKKGITLRICYSLGEPHLNGMPFHFQLRELLPANISELEKVIYSQFCQEL